MWIEDTITELGTGPDAVKELPFDGEMHVVERDPRMLRYSSAIRAKWNQWAEFQRRGIVEANEPYLVAVNGGLLSWADVDHGVPDMVRTVLGLGEAKYVWNRDPSVPNEVQYPRRPEVRKASGSPVRMEFFATPTCDAISGLFFSARRVWDAAGGIGDDLQLVHNSCARNPLPRGTFPFGCEWWFDAETETVNRKLWR